MAVEIDKDLFALVSDRLGNNSALELVYGNFLDIDLPREPYKVFANIPFSITGEIIKKLLFSKNPPNDCSLVVQKEAAEKFIVNTHKNSMLSVLFYPFFDIKIEYVFKRTDFKPTPSVDLCMLRIVKRPTPLISKEKTDKYRDFVVYKFTKCREAGEWTMARWLNSYTKDIPCGGSFLKWQGEQSNGFP